MSLEQWGEAAMGAVMGAPMQIALEKALELVEPLFYYKKWAKDLEETALSLKPDIDKYVEIASDPDLSTPRYQRYKKFQGLLESAIGRARQAEEINMLEKFNYAEEIHEFLEKIHEFIRIEGPPNLALDSQKLRVDVGSLGQKLAQVELLSCQNISPTQTNIDGIHGAQAAERSNSINSQVPPKPEKALGLDERIDEVKKNSQPEGCEYHWNNGDGRERQNHSCISTLPRSWSQRYLSKQYTFHSRLRLSWK